MLALALSSGNTPDIYWEEQGMHEYDVVKKKKIFFPLPVTGSYYVVQANLWLTVLLPQPPRCWDENVVCLTIPI